VIKLLKPAGACIYDVLFNLYPAIFLLIFVVTSESFPNSKRSKT
jgi:hypothetical protein